MAKVLIVYEFPIVAYSPTTLQLYDELVNRGHTVKILTYEPIKTHDTKILNRDITYVDFKYPSILRFLLKTVFSILNFDVERFRWIHIPRSICFQSILILFRLNSLIKYYDRIIISDLSFLYYYSKFFTKKVDVLSLEILDEFKKITEKARVKNILSGIIIQSEVRFNYLFKGYSNYFLIQNSPVFNKSLLSPEKLVDHFIFAGTGFKGFGLYQSVSVLDYSLNYKLTIKGRIPDEEMAFIKTNYHSYLDSERLIIDTIFLENDEFIKFISKYSVGFAFYDLDDPVFGTFNYQTAPSGKLFKYLAAGLPVVGSDIEAFKFLEYEGAGVLVKNLSGDEINKAILKIKENYTFYSTNALRMAEKFSFDKMVAPYMDTYRT